MKGKPTFKPAGLHAKRWREASQVRGAANLLPSPKPPKQQLRRKKGGMQPPYEQEAPESGLRPVL